VTVVFILLNVVLIGVIAWWFRRKTPPALATIYWPALAVKLVAGMALGLLYKYYFEAGSDTFGFFRDALRINEWAVQSPGAYFGFLLGGELGVEIYNSEPRTLLFITILSLVNFISGFNYWLSSCWLSLFSFLGAWQLFEVLSKHFPRHRTVFAIALLFFPSITFWGAGILKESLAWGSMCLICAAFVDGIHKRAPRRMQWVVLALAILLLLNLKYYWAAVLAVCTITSLIIRFAPWRGVPRLSVQTVLWLVLFAMLILIVTRTHPNFHMERFVSVIVENHNTIIDSSEPENVIHYNNLHQSWSSLAFNAPWALLSGLFRPFVFEAHSVASCVYAIENLLLLVLFIAWITRPQWSRENHIILLATVVCCVVLCVFLALSTPNFGTLSRYRIGFLPFLVILLLSGSRLVQVIPKRFRLEDAG
jgi:hypothetical protein